MGTSVVPLPFLLLLLSSSLYLALKAEQEANGSTSSGAESEPLALVVTQDPCGPAPCPAHPPKDIQDLLPLTLLRRGDVPWAG